MLIALWLEVTASFEDHATELGGAEAVARLPAPATRFVHLYLRSEG